MYLGENAAGGDTSRALRMVEEAQSTRRGKRSKKSKRGRAGGSAGARPSRTTTANDGGSPALETLLRAWRTQEAKKRGIPAFRILTDRTLTGIVRASPTDEAELLEVSGIGPTMLAKYGRALLGVVARAAQSD